MESLLTSSFPFDLSEPAFSIVFCVVAASVLIAARAWLRRSERGDMPGIALPTDPAVIAYLHGGAIEAITVAVLTLIDRGAVECPPDGAAAGTLSVTLYGRHRGATPLEEKIVGILARPVSLPAIVEPGVVMLADTYCTEVLSAHGLMPDGRTQRRRWWVLGLAWLVPTAMFCIRMAQLIAAGAAGGTALTAAWLGFSVVTVLIALSMRSNAARRTIEALRGQYDEMRRQAASWTSGNGERNLPLLVAVFGAHEAPAEAAPHVGPLAAAIRSAARANML